MMYANDYSHDEISKPFCGNCLLTASSRLALGVTYYLPLSASIQNVQRLKVRLIQEQRKQQICLIEATPQFHSQQFILSLSLSPYKPESELDYFSDPCRSIGALYLDLHSVVPARM